MKAQMQKGFTLIELMIVVAIIGILAAIAIPQYQNYVSKSQAARVMSEAGGLKTAIETCILEGRTAIGTGATQCDPGATGSNLQVDGGNSAPAITKLPTGTGVPTVTSPLTTTTTIVATFGNNASAALQASGRNTLTWTRDANGTWACTSTIEAKFRPAGCTN
ncbi:pilin [Ectopseudomonas oleovorans]|uniref:pilin n=1 Tax=Ectopseudomonas oleovorans TaxID=301 RepID=UPI000A00C4E8|nr:pilin [Pseudomonas oleovorans]